jgi:cyclopropane fatty-acyl-phospholipid synthase-like methyltransferase
MKLKNPGSKTFSMLSKLLNKPRCTNEALITKRAYRLLDFFCEKTGLMLDYSEGYYKEGEDTSYEQAQENQTNFILDSIKCDQNSVILDVGCGNGRLIRAAKKRGARAVGITICQEQVDFLRKEGLEVYLCNVFDCDTFFKNERFTGIVCNGSLEHFVTNRNAFQNQDDRLYTKVFENFYKISAPQALIMTTVIHFNKDPNQYNYIDSDIKNFEYLSYDWRIANLVQFWGGWYPKIGQLEKNAAKFFRKAFELDATKHYLRTAETAMYFISKGAWSLKNLSYMVRGVFDLLITDPYHMYIAFLHFRSDTWLWQFQGENPPMKHMWNVWAKIE